MSNTTATFQELFAGKNLQSLIALVNANLGKPDTLLAYIMAFPGMPEETRWALTKPGTKNALSSMAPIEYLACGLMKHSSSHPTAEILADWALGASGTPMRINRIRLMANVFFS